MSSMEHSTNKIYGENLKQGFLSLKQEQPHIRPVNAAQLLGVTEGVLLASRMDKDITRLSDDPMEILKSLHQLGYVMALTRNPYCVHERKGIYDNFSVFKHGARIQGVYLNPDIDLRLVLNHWAFAFAVMETSMGKELKSLQFFNQQGVAVHKVYLTEQSDYKSYQACIEKFRNLDQSNRIITKPAPAENLLKKDDEIDWVKFRAAWEAMQDIHDLYPLIARYKISRVQAFRNIGKDFSYRVNTGSVRKVLELACDKKCEIMVFAGNPACTQIHTGPIENLKETGPWYNVLDDKFSLHLKDEGLETVWVTKKPTKDGILTALEAFDQNGNPVITLFGKSKPGTPETLLWREIIETLPALESSN